jgi:hypothetical protein
LKSPTGSGDFDVVRLQHRHLILIWSFGRPIFHSTIKARTAANPPAYLRIFPHDLPEIRAIQRDRRRIVSCVRLMGSFCNRWWVSVNPPPIG